MRTIALEIKELEHQLVSVAEATLDEAGKMGVDEARSTTLFKHGPTFDEQITFSPDGSFEGEVKSNAPYSHWLEYGNDQNGSVIYPTTAKVLHFWSGGKEVFVKFVKAHGPLPFMQEAGDKVEAALPDIWAHQFDKVIR